MKRFAKVNQLDPTPFCTLLVKKGVSGQYNIPKKRYDPKGKPYPAKLEAYYHDQLFEYTIKWDCSLKEAAYHILIFMLEQESRKPYEK